MKKILFSLVIMLTMVLSANAQVYVGGSLNMHANKNAYNLAVSPEVGYSFQGNTGVGCVFDFAYEKDGDFGFGVNPYFEYRFMEIDKFTLYLHTYLHYNNMGTYDDLNAFIPGNNYGVSVHPGVIWNATDHWSAAFYVGGIEYMWNQPKGTAFKDGTGDFNLGFETSMPFAVALYYSF